MQAGQTFLVEWIEFAAQSLGRLEYVSSSKMKNSYFFDKIGTNGDRFK